MASTASVGKLTRWVRILEETRARFIAGTDTGYVCLTICDVMTHGMRGEVAELCCWVERQLDGYNSAEQWLRHVGGIVLSSEEMVTWRIYWIGQMIGILLQTLHEVRNERVS